MSLLDEQRDISAEGQRAAIFYANKRESEVRACNCIGPQNGQPKCPCMMRGVIVRNGRWVEPEKDLGPVK